MFICRWRTTRRGFSRASQLILLGFKIFASSFIAQRLGRRLVIEQPPLVGVTIRDDTSHEDLIYRRNEFEENLLVLTVLANLLLLGVMGQARIHFCIVNPRAL